MNIISNELLRHVIPIFGKRGNKPVLVGNGVLIKREDTCYLVTAAHVVDEIGRGEELFLYVKEGFTQRLAGNFVISKIPSNGSRLVDKVDVAVIRIEGPSLPPFKEVNKYPVDISALMPRVLPRDNKEYLLVGFPASRSKVNPNVSNFRSSPYAFRNGSIPESKYIEVGVKPESHVLIGFNKRRVFNDDNGLVEEAPLPRGMSGAPLWHIYTDSEEVDILNPKIVGIFIEYKKKHDALLFTDIFYTLDAMKGVS